MSSNIKLDKICTYIIIALSIIVATILYLTKSEVMALDFQTKETKRQIAEEQKSINLLKAEESYLKADNNIKNYITKDSNFKKIDLAQIVENPLNESVNNNKQMIATEVKNRSNSYKTVKWRYKKSQYAVTHVSSTKNLNKARK